MRGLIVEELEGNEELRFSTNAQLQFDLLVAKPLLSLKQGANRQGPILLIVDGLDWCQGAADFFTLFFTHLSGPDSSHIRVLITSRPSPDICNDFEKCDGLHRSINLDEIPNAQKDIESYLCDGLTQIYDTLGLSRPPDGLNRADLDSFVNDSRNSFLYAKYALKFIGDSKVRNPADQLQNWLLKKFNGDRDPFEDMYSHWVAEIGAPPIGLLVVAICVSQDPVPLASLAELLQTDISWVKASASRLGEQTEEMKKQTKGMQCFGPLYAMRAESSSQLVLCHEFAAVGVGNGFDDAHCIQLGFYGVKVLTEEAWHFAEDNQQAFAESPFQVYRAVLDLPEDSELRRIYKAEAENRLSAFEEANRAGAPDGDIPLQS
ncbi:hypothetical protein SCHPADRAFT_932330 [Schizopora paradoxa]|uniref:Nephrocystin 3-like N-terminal domain-containing protein n=1 Tax=Schizopora paradoxa TaxID=27342 RepID=A0A0H2R8A1_9AGAM|nr:hypothetical protein SCHPADRAFT_932330 [Schizopora paradoxa]